MSKYIVKNCPCYWHIGEDDGCSLGNMKSCEDDTGCVMKQIVSRCQETINIMHSDCGSNPYAGGRCTEAEGILQLLDIKEVE